MDHHWDPWRRRLQYELEVIADREVVMFAEPEGPPVPRSWFRKADSAPIRYVQLLRYEDDIQAECVGAQSFGGSWRVRGLTAGDALEPTRQ